MPTVMPPERTKFPDKRQWRVIWGTVAVALLAWAISRDMNALPVVAILGFLSLWFMQTRKWRKP